MADWDPAGGCPDEELISAYVEHRLDLDVRDEIERHLDSCENCSRLIADLVRIYSDDPSGPSELSAGSLTKTEGVVAEDRQGPELLPPGSAIGRYRTLECVGMGGMGVVYAAYDPQLDRRVALKLLLDTNDKNRDRKRARLLREAQSMAKLTHTNVITVHDVGVWHGQVFVAMEFVEGGTLKSWMRKTRRSWPEIREIMLAAGRGLAAAHEAGLVHRDFKPDNVLIGDDGRVRVTDFGLARWEDGAVSTGQKILSGSDDPSLSLDDDEGLLSAEVSLTRTGALVGTPAYMAPELYAHEVADAATDQFAFCVALYEALYGERPFKGSTLAELATNVVSSDSIEFPGAVSVPRHVRNVIRRGLAQDRADRYPSMQPLLRTLERRGVRQWRTAGVVAIPALAVGLGIWASNRTQAESVHCDDAGAPLTDVWNAERRSQIERAFAESDSRLAKAASIALLDSVDSFAQTWSQTAQQACVLRAAGGRETFVELSERCLARNRIALDVALQGYAVVDEADVGRAAGLVSSIAQDCTDEEALLRDVPPPVPEAFKDDAEHIRLELAKVDGYVAAGEYQDGVDLARSLDAQAETLEIDALEAETKLALGQLLDLAGEYEPAAEAFEKSEILAVATRFHRITAESLVHLVYVRGVILQQHDEARRIAERAAAAGKAAGLGATFEAALLMNRASIEYSAAQFDAAEAFAAEALELQDREKDPLRWADAAFNLASIRIARGHYDTAIPTLRRYIDTFEAEVGHVHPDVAIGYHTLSIALVGMERTAEGETALRTALDITEQTVGKDHPSYAPPLSDLAVLEAKRENYGAAIELARRSLEIRNTHGYEPLSAAAERLRVSEWMAYLGQIDDAKTEVERALADALQAVGPDHPRLADFHAGRALVAAYAGDRPTTDASMAGARVLLEANFSADSEALWKHHRAHAGMLDELGFREEAITRLRTLISTASGEHIDERAAAARFDLAKLLEKAAPDSEEATALADAALRGFRASGSLESAASVVRWMESR